ncbi:MAG TPA: DUF4394 domain-containing protein [Actinomycetales bacterium]|jgi:hypothetical protein
MRKRTRTTVAATIAVAAVGFAVPAATSSAASRTATGVSAAVPAATTTTTTPIIAAGLTTKGQLASFDIAAANKAKVVGSFTGLVEDTSVVGIDYRVQDGLLYALGNAGGIYTVVPTTAAATLVGRLTVPLLGTYFDIDFNPMADALRIVADTGQNLRHPFAAGVANGTTVRDTPLAYTTGPGGGISAAAYTNNDVDAATGTALFDLDTMKDQVAQQVPANAGSLTPTGTLGVDIGASAGFDILTVTAAGRSVGNLGLAAVLVDRTYKLYAVDLLSGAATAVTGFPRGAQIVDLAVPTAAP